MWTEKAKIPWISFKRCWKITENQNNIIDKATITLEIKSEKIEEERKKAGRFILATNILNNLSPSEILKAYKGQQSCEQGFRFFKDPLFFAADRFSQIPIQNRIYGNAHGSISVGLQYWAKTIKK